MDEENEMASSVDAMCTWLNDNPECVARCIKEGVRESMDFWLSQHDVSTPDIIQAGVMEAMQGDGIALRAEVEQLRDCADVMKDKINDMVQALKSVLADCADPDTDSHLSYDVGKKIIAAMPNGLTPPLTQE